MLVQMSFLQEMACRLLAVTSVLNEAAEMMCEEDHIKAKLLPKIRQEIEELTPPDKDLKEHLDEIFNFVNFDEDLAGINLKEFSSLLFTVDLILSDNEVDILFRAVDSNGSGHIEFGELFELFRPNSTLVSKKIEDGDERRMKQLSHQESCAHHPVDPLPALHPHHHHPKTKPHTVVPIVSQSDLFADIESAGEQGEEQLQVQDEEKNSCSVHMLE
jgi:Ca2+-binding EF-hand superfamily protein